MLGACGPYLPLEWLMPYEYQEFPKWTRKGKEERLVHSREELEALGEGWSDEKHNPPKVYVDSDAFLEYPKMVNGVIVQSADEEAALAPVEPEQSDERSALIQIAEEKGVKIDKRWSNDKIRAALEAA